jgi:WbqC-like protein family
MKRLAIIQSSYIPWKGFFDFISRCDAYIIYDSAAFSKGHWHNRNKIKRNGGSPWLTIPVKTADRLGQPIDEVGVVEGWAERHWDTLSQSYKGSAYFEAERADLKKLFELLAREPLLTKINEEFLRWLSQRLGLNIQIARDRSFSFSGDRTERLIQLCEAVGATHYLSGPSAKEYLDVQQMKAAAITVEWMTYGPYRSYPQPHGDFAHEVSILDTLICTGPGAREFITPLK